MRPIKQGGHLATYFNLKHITIHSHEDAQRGTRNLRSYAVATYVRMSSLKGSTKARSNAETRSLEDLKEGDKYIEKQ